LRAQAQEIATNNRTAEYSFSPISIIAFFNVSPWLLCTVIAHARLIEICMREQVPFFATQLCLIGVIRTSLLPSSVIIAQYNYQICMGKERRTLMFKHNFSNGAHRSVDQTTRLIDGNRALQIGQWLLINLSISLRKLCKSSWSDSGSCSSLTFWSWFSSWWLACSAILDFALILRVCSCCLLRRVSRCSAVSLAIIFFLFSRSQARCFSHWSGFRSFVFPTFTFLTFEWFALNKNRSVIHFFFILALFLIF
jgi:hypothetical protein